MDKPEIHMHIGVTLISNARNPDPKAQEHTELCQFAAQFPDHSYGLLPVAAVDRALSEFRHGILEKLRGAGVLGAGQ